MSKFPFRIVKNEAASEANIFLYGIVGDYWYSDNPVTARSLQRQLTILSDYKRINLRMNGPGGDVHEGLLILNTIRADKGDRIHTYNDGVCASMMAVLLEAVPEERRHAAKASLTMIHQASTYAWGNASDLRDTAEMLDKHDDVLAGVFADGLDWTLDKVKAEWFDGKDHWLTAEEGAALGLFTVEDYDIADIPENPINQPLDKIAAFYTKPAANNSQSNPQPPQINNENMFGTNKFKGLSAMAKLAVSDITPELVKAVNDEIEAEKIPGVTLVLDSTLEEVTAKADKADSLEIDNKAKDQKITDLEAVVAAQKTKLDAKPAATSNQPVPAKPDPTPADGTVENEIQSPQDIEQARLLEVCNLIP